MIRIPGSGRRLIQASDARRTDSDPSSLGRRRLQAVGPRPLASNRRHLLRRQQPLQLGAGAGMEFRRVQPRDAARPQADRRLAAADQQTEQLAQRRFMTNKQDRLHVCRRRVRDDAGQPPAGQRIDELDGTLQLETPVDDLRCLAGRGRAGCRAPATAGRPDAASRPRRLACAGGPSERADATRPRATRRPAPPPCRDASRTGSRAQTKLRQGDSA